MALDNEETLKMWILWLGKRINQRGFDLFYRPIRKIGKGVSATVYLAERINDKEKFAIKVFTKSTQYALTKGL